jgi:hypothetical protein
MFLFTRLLTVTDGEKNLHADGVALHFCGMAPDIGSWPGLGSGYFAEHSVQGRITPVDVLGAPFKLI